MKLAGMLLLVLASTGAGCLAAGKLRSQRQALELLCAWTADAAACIRYTHAELPELLGMLAEHPGFRRFRFAGEILEKLAPLIPRPFTVSIREALFSGNTSQLRKELANLLMHSVNAFDPAPENVFPGFVLGLCAVTEGCFRIQSSRPEGSPRFERFEIALFPKEDRAEGRLPGILIDLTAAKTADHTNLQVLAREEIAQMDDQPFAAQMRAEGIETIIKYEAAFSGRRVVILMQ